MKILVKAACAAGLLALGACGGGADDRAAANIEAAGENQADALEAQADATNNDQLHDALEAKADNIEDAADAAADRADDQDDARIENQVANHM
ncbi:MAG: hypothetical protein J7500_04120 [Sphingomonas sp.]|uniref:hypothetical protein n=1 Tax=Sphingomonas sp. TaxID=28214 RepID=UPI001AFFE955|nr:hypothetical protein [Sphingomonas sp.]MBO9621879.1 hypothetical protein [Sphingomonas sp.]